MALLADTSGFSVDVSPAGEAKVEVSGSDLRVSGGVVDEIAVVWADDNDGDGNSTLATRKLATDLTAKSDEEIKSDSALTSPNSAVSGPSVTRLANGTLVYVQTNNTPVGTIYTSTIRIIDSSGNQIGSDISIQNISQGMPSVAALTGGRFAVSYNSAQSQFGGNKIHIYEPDGSVITQSIAIQQQVQVIAHVHNVAGPMVQPAWDFRQG